MCGPRSIFVEANEASRRSKMLDVHALENLRKLRNPFENFHLNQWKFRRSFTGTRAETSLKSWKATA